MKLRPLPAESVALVPAVASVVQPAAAADVLVCEGAESESRPHALRA